MSFLGTVGLLFGVIFFSVLLDGLYFAEVEEKAPNKFFHIFNTCAFFILFNALVTFFVTLCDNRIWVLVLCLIISVGMFFLTGWATSWGREVSTTAGE